MKVERQCHQLMSIRYPFVTIEGTRRWPLSRYHTALSARPPYLTPLLTLRCLHILACCLTPLPTALSHAPHRAGPTNNTNDTCHQLIGSDEVTQGRCGALQPGFALT